MTDHAATLIVVGMHRSGTSLTAGLLQSAGLHIGSELMQGNSSNPRGHFENIDFYRFHQAVLRSQGVNEDGWTLQESIAVEDPYIQEAQILIQRHGIAPMWGWKDPRTVLLLNFWAQQLPDSKFLCVYRAPWEVVDSLYRRGDKLFQKQPELAIKVWIHYNRKILDFYKKSVDRCILVNLSIVTASFSKLIEKLNAKFELHLSPQSEAELYNPAFLDRQTSESHYPSQIDHYFPEAIELYQSLEKQAWYPKKCKPDRTWRTRTKADSHRIAAFQNWQQIRELERMNRTLTAQLQAEQSQVQQLQQQVDILNLNPSRADYEALQQQWQGNEAKLKEIQADRLKLQSSLVAAEQRLLEMQVRLDKSRSQSESLKIERSQLAADFEAQAIILQQMQQDLGVAVQREMDQQAVVQELRQSLTDRESELNRIQTELHQTETQRQQLQTLLEESQVDLATTQAALHTSEVHLSATRRQVEALQAELDQAKVENVHFTGQLHQYQNQYQTELAASQLQVQEQIEFLGVTQIRLHQAELESQQLAAKLQDRVQQLELAQIQLQTAETSIEQLQIQLHQTLDREESAQVQLEQTTTQLQQMQHQHQAAELARDHLAVQLHQAQAQAQHTQTELQVQLETKSQQAVQLHTQLEEQSHRSLQLQARLHELQQSYEQTQAQLQQSQATLEHYRYQVDRSNFQATLTPPEIQASTQSQTQPETPSPEYQMAVWEAWYAFQQGNFDQMSRYLKQSLQLTAMNRSEIILEWVRSFDQLSRSQQTTFAIDQLLSTPEWQHLTHQLIRKKRLVIP
ncbi:MAG: hypothetical protein MUF72_13255 [Elainella sp. Prado103]|nr:hypothetical protein [Elainella sp. Prado103]